MPELPEVETVARDLEPLILGKSITEVWWSGKKMRLPWTNSWDRALEGLIFTKVSRRAKWLVLHLAERGAGWDWTGGSALIAHLGMTGQLTFVRRGKEYELPKDHVHLRFGLVSSGKKANGLNEGLRRDFEAGELRFRDIRRFGGMAYAKDSAEVDLFFVKHRLGPEPWDCPLDGWLGALSGTKRLIKAVLLDQSVISGVGNIYADESLHAAGIHPCRMASSLSEAEGAKLLEMADSVMRKAIENRGSTIRDYVGGENLNGGHQNSLLVYGREGEACFRCGILIKRFVVAGRSSHFCPVCQKAPKEAGAKPVRHRRGPA